MDQPERLTQWDGQLGMQLSEQGQRRALGATSDEWKRLAKESADWVVKFCPTFTTDEIWHRMVTVDPDLARAHKPQAIGAVVKNLHNAGIIEPTGRHVNSVRAEAHCNPKREWTRV